MNLTLRTQPAPSIPPHIQEELDSLWPRVFLRWQPRYKPVGEEGWEGRWEIWVELDATSHPDFDARRKHILDPERDIWNTDAQCWMRFLQTYTHEDDSFAPADERLIVGLEMADTWSNPHFYREHIEEAYERSEQARIQSFKEAARGSSSYFDDLDRTLVGPHSRTADWRHRIR